jgi:acetyl esterase/lipase
MLKTLATVSILLAASATFAQDAAQPIPLWPDGAPGALGKEEKDVPTITPFLADPAKATGAAFVICPGGAYAGLADHEGSHYARWLNEQGISGFVLKYRLGSKGYRHPAMLQDAARAIRLVRSKADAWKLDPNKIGIMGSSAGGHLASTALTHFDAGDPSSSDPVERLGSRPDLGILCYAVISMGTNTHSGSRKNLLGDNPKPELVQLLSNELQVTTNTPPCFIWHTWEDKTVRVENSLDFGVALRAHRVPFELHIYEKGPHGIGLGAREWNPAKWHRWTTDCAAWLKERGFGR